MRSPLSPSRTALKPPPPFFLLPPPSSFCQRLPHPLHQSPPGTSASSFNNPAASEPLSCFTQRNAHTRSCVLVSIFTSLSSHLSPPSPLAPSSCSSCCWVTVRAPIILLNLPNIHTHTHKRAVRVSQRAMISTVDSSLTTGHAILSFSPH